MQVEEEDVKTNFTCIIRVRRLAAFATCKDLASLATKMVETYSFSIGLQTH